MLKTFSAWNGQPCALLLGGFDGFHCGHRTLFSAAKQTGLPVGLTTISGNKAGGDVFTFSERETIFLREGFDFCEELRFADIKELSAQDFFAGLLERFPIKAVFCGEDFRFGKDALGTPQLLKELSPCPVHVLPLLTADGEKLAVSKMKRLIAEGSVFELSRLLGYDYFVQGEVEHGRRVGRTVGFPTVNIRFPTEKFPLKEGVYGGTAQTPFGVFPAVVHFGSRPTFGLQERVVEAYLDGFSGDLYGQTVRICPQKYYRPVQKFASAEALRKQLERDVKRLQEEAVR